MKTIVVRAESVGPQTQALIEWLRLLFPECPVFLSKAASLAGEAGRAARPPNAEVSTGSGAERAHQE